MEVPDKVITTIDVDDGDDFEEGDAHEGISAGKMVKQ
jgi:hypothetical protein